jgi:trk system potassium uptake protein TrkA
MKIIVCGAGQVGWQIARHLSSEDNDVTVIDNNAGLVRSVIDTLDVKGIPGFASHPDILGMAGARDADMIVAATHSDEVNMVTCQVAHSIFAVPRKIARLRSQAYLDAIYSDLYRRDHLPIDVVISPEKEVAEAALRRLSVPTAFDSELFLDGEAQFLGITLTEDCTVTNTPLSQLSELFSTLRALVVGIRRNGKLFVPERDDQLYPNDDVYLFTAVEDIERTMEIFGKSHSKAERFIIVGGGYVGRAIARRLERDGRKLRAKVIEKNREVAEQAADVLERTVVLHGDGLNIDLLEEANIGNADALLGVTDDDKTNLLSCARAKASGVPLTITLVNDPSMVGLLSPLNIDAYINPRATTVSSILRHIRHGRIKAVYSIGDAEAEIIEAQVLGTSPVAGRRLSEIEWPPGAIVGAILKGGKITKPSGNTMIEEGDIVTVFVLRADVVQVEKLFQVTIDFF